VQALLQLCGEFVLTGVHNQDENLTSFLYEKERLHSLRSFLPTISVLLPFIDDSPGQRFPLRNFLSDGEPVGIRLAVLKILESKLHLQPHAEIHRAIRSNEMFFDCAWNFSGLESRVVLVTGFHDIPYLRQRVPPGQDSLSTTQQAVHLGCERDPALYIALTRTNMRLVLVEPDVEFFARHYKFSESKDRVLLSCTYPGSGHVFVGSEGGQQVISPPKVVPAESADTDSRHSTSR
jgi:hypothetical protein